MSLSLESTQIPLIWVTAICGFVAVLPSIWSPSDGSAWHRRFHRVTTFFGILTIVGGLASGVIGYQLSIDADVRIANANENAAKATKRAAEANQAAAAANKAAAEANERAAQADKLAAEATERANAAALELEEYKTPRRLDVLQQSLVTNRVRKFNGTTFLVGIPFGDPEASKFADQIDDALVAGGWTPATWQEFEILIDRGPRAKGLGIAQTGVVVWIHPDHKELEQPALAVAGALKDQGINVKVEWSALMRPKNSPSVQVLVGKKN